MTDVVVTIIIATFNRSHFIPETLQAIERQSYKNFECLIIDDGSSDGTENRIHNLALDRRFKYCKRPKTYSKGPSGCRNYGLDQARGDYIIFFDDDDVPHPDNLMLCVNSLNKGFYSFCRYDRAVFHGDFSYNFDSQTSYNSFKIGTNDLYNLITNRLPFNACAVMWDRECFDNNRFQAELQYAEEWELYARILSQGFEGISIKKTLYYARKHPESNTGEFYAGSKKRMKSMIKASKLVISNLNNRDLLSADLIRFFSWESVRLKSRSLFHYLLGQSSLSFQEGLRIRFIYYTGPFKKSLMCLKKRLK